MIKSFNRTIILAAVVTVSAIVCFAYLITIDNTAVANVSLSAAQSSECPPARCNCEELVTTNKKGAPAPDGSTVSIEIDSDNSLKDTDTTTRRTLISKDKAKGRNINSDELAKQTSDVLVLGLKELARAYRHARSSKTLKSIQKAHGIFYSYLQAVLQNETAEAKLENNEYLTPENVTSKDVCPEIWGGMEHGYPFYHIGHDLVNCSYAPAMSTILTVILHFTDPEPSSVRTLISQIREVYRNISVIVLSPKSLRLEVNNTKTLVSNSSSLGAFVNEAMKYSSTKYTAIASDLHYFDNDTRLERLIRMLDVGKVDIAAGSHRNSSGYWRRGCYQSKLEYYKYKLVEGYDLSYNSCIFCDYVSGPFVARTDFLQNHMFRKTNATGYLEIVNYFEDLKEDDVVVATCPDSLFHTNARSVPQQFSRDELRSFAKAKTLVQIIFPEPPLLDGTQKISKHDFSCEEIEHKCSNNAGKGIANLHCCSAILAETMRYLFDKTEALGIDFEQDAGNLMGAVKFQSVLPWELDADFNYRSIPENVEKMTKLVTQFATDGYRLRQDESCTDDERGNFTCRFFALWKLPYRLECWGMGNELAQDHVSARGLNVTRVFLDGRWYVGYYNPAKFLRNRYGDDIFQHAEHWSNLGHETSWETFETGRWLNCSKPGYQGCLSRFLPVGDLQFWEPSI